MTSVMSDEESDLGELHVSKHSRSRMRGGNARGADACLE